MHAAQGFLGQGVALAHHPGNTEVRNLDRAVFQHHHVMGLNIPVDNATAVGVFQCLGDLNTEVKGFLPVQRTLILHVFLQTDALDQLHNNIVRHDRCGNIVHRDDIGMAQHGNCLALRVETTTEILVIQIVIFQNFDCHQTV